jgi:hypothetical protein
VAIAPVSTTAGEAPSDFLRLACTTSRLSSAVAGSRGSVV